MVDQLLSRFCASVCIVALAPGDTARACAGMAASAHSNVPSKCVACVTQRCKLTFCSHVCLQVHEAEVIERLRAAQKENQRLLDAKGNAAHSTAEPRPHAYIPEKLGIPKPYGVFAPFKPVEPGSTMRHIRKPEIPEIVI